MGNLILLKRVLLLFLEKIDKSFQKQRDNNLKSVAHGGRGLREEREFKKRMKGKQVMNK